MEISVTDALSYKMSHQANSGWADTTVVGGDCRYGAEHTIVVRDGPRLSESLAAAGGLAPRLALDAIGGESGRRLLRMLRPGSSIVCYAMRSESSPVWFCSERV